MKQLERRKKTLADQVLNLEGKVSQINQLCVELFKSIEICESFNELLSKLLGYLEFANTMEITFEAELIKARKAIYFLCGQTESIRVKLENSDPKTVEIGLHFECLRAVNKNLSAIKSLLESEISIFLYQRIKLRTDYGYNRLH